MDNVQADASLQVEAPVVDSNTQVSNDDAVKAEGQSQASAEKMIPQSQVGKIAAREAREAVAKREAQLRSEYEQRIAQLSQQQNANPNQAATNVGGIPQQSPDEIRRVINDMAIQHQANLMDSTWKSAMKAEMERDPNFADAYDELGIEEHPELIIWMAGMDNKADVVRELANNPSKYFNLLIAKSASPKMAQKELAKLSASIKANEDAKKQAKAPAPLSQLKPSNIGGDDGNLSVSDFRNQPWLRG